LFYGGEKGVNIKITAAKAAKKIVIVIATVNSNYLH
jgi:hypothetical protein